MAPKELNSRTHEQLEMTIVRHREAGKIGTPFCVNMMVRLPIRTVKTFNLKLAFDHLVEAAKSETPIDFKQAAGTD